MSVCPLAVQVVLASYPGSRWAAIKNLGTRLTKSVLVLLHSLVPRPLVGEIGMKLVA